MKRYYQSFFIALSVILICNPGFRNLNIDQLVIAGLYTHACVRSTVLDAYKYGYKVTVAGDAVASEDVLHDQVSKEWLGSRACRIGSVSEIIHDLNFQPGRYNPTKEKASSTGKTFAVSYAFGKWGQSKKHDFWEQRNPSDWDEILSHVSLGRTEDIQQAVKSAKKGESVWARTPLNERLKILSAWMNELKNREDEIVSLLALEVGKPLEAGLAEFRFGLNLLKETIRRAKQENDGDIESGVAVRYRPLGTVALITPWNNPFAIPLGKIAPALVCGNTVVWKPALQSPRMVSLFVKTLKSTSLSDSCLNIIMGDAVTAQILAQQEDIKSISFTGSVAGGKDLAAISSQYGKRFQAEMGGNNAVLIGRSANASEIAKELVSSVYSFSGQRCTAPRRLLIADEIFDEFTDTFTTEMEELKIGFPDQTSIQVGPLISKSQQTRMVNLIEESRNDGTNILKGGGIPKSLDAGCWFEPTLVTNVDPSDRIFQEESSGR